MQTRPTTDPPHVLPRHATQRLPSCRHPSKTKQPWSLQEHQQHNNRKQRSRWEAGFVAILRDRNLADQRFKAQACQQGTRLLRIDDTKLVRLDTGAWLLLGFFGVAASCIQRAGVRPPNAFASSSTTVTPEDCLSATSVRHLRTHSLSAS